MPIAPDAPWTQVLNEAVAALQAVWTEVKGPDDQAYLCPVPAAFFHGENGR